MSLEHRKDRRAAFVPDTKKIGDLFRIMVQHTEPHP